MANSRWLSALRDPALPDRSLAPVHVDERVDPLGPQPSSGGARCSDKGFLNMTAAEYLQLLDWTARQRVPGKRGSTPEEAPSILQRVGLTSTVWQDVVSNFGQLFHNVAGQPHEIARMRSRRRNIRFRVPMRPDRSIPAQATCTYDQNYSPLIGRSWPHFRTALAAHMNP